MIPFLYGQIRSLETERVGPRLRIDVEGVASSEDALSKLEDLCGRLNRLSGTDYEVVAMSAFGVPEKTLGEKELEQLEAGEET